jgi:hypothetical protein
MKINVNHIVELLEYLHKESVLEVEVSERSMSTGQVFTFFDKENRECEITIFQAALNSAPQLTKTMKLYTRASRKTKKDHIADALAEKAAKEALEDN